MQRRCLLDMERVCEHGQSELRAGPTAFGASGVQAIGLGLRRLGSHPRWPEEGQMSVAECSRLFSPSCLSDAEGRGCAKCRVLDPHGDNQGCHGFTGIRSRKV